MITPTVVSAGMTAFGSRWRSTTCRRSSPFPVAVLMYGAEPTSATEAERIRRIGPEIAIPSVRAGSSTVFRLARGWCSIET